MVYELCLHLRVHMVNGVSVMAATQGYYFSFDTIRSYTRLHISISVIKVELYCSLFAKPKKCVITA